MSLTPQNCKLESAGADAPLAPPSGGAKIYAFRSHVRSGMVNAKAKGKQIGRPQTTKDSIPAIFRPHYPAYESGQLNITELSRVCDLSRTTIHKYISLLEA